VGCKFLGKTAASEKEEIERKITGGSGSKRLHQRADKAQLVMWGGLLCMIHRGGRGEGLGSERGSAQKGLFNVGSTRISQSAVIILMVLYRFSRTKYRRREDKGTQQKLGGGRDRRMNT